VIVEQGQYLATEIDSIFHVSGRQDLIVPDKLKLEAESRTDDAQGRPLQ
jgi:hypothetical protein